MVTEDDGDDLDIPMSPWADALTAALATAEPKSVLFREFSHFAMRAGLNTPGPSVVAADVASVMDECGVNREDLADRLNAPLVYVYAIERGWHRLGLRGLALVAEALDVPLGAFFVGADNRRRLEVRRFSAYRQIAKTTILGEDEPPF